MELFDKEGTTLYHMVSHKVAPIAAPSYYMDAIYLRNFNHVEI